MKPLLIKYLHEYSEPVDNPNEFWEENCSFKDSYSLYPPEITPTTLIFEIDDYITSEVPISEIIPLASPELLEFLQ